VAARFELERQALALMDHPGIARVLDAGAAPNGRPYFVMEYVRGEPLTAYSKRHKLPVSERLELFGQVCDAVQHAHQKGIIHRDLKPSNVLVAVQDDRPIPKIIDFGVAKATAHTLIDVPLHTELGEIIGTPEYMSPEQAEVTGLDVDTRTDVYALGVILDELLTGTLPFEPKALREKGIDDIRRTIREMDPPRPSTRVLGLAITESRQRSEAARLASRLKGDLDWVRLRSEGLTRHEAVHAIGTVLAEQIFHALKGESGTSSDLNESYLDRMRRLTADEWRNSGELETRSLSGR
jgi:serine/threonine protein kinase